MEALVRPFATYNEPDVESWDAAQATNEPNADARRPLDLADVVHDAAEPGSVNFADSQRAPVATREPEHGVGAHPRVVHLLDPRRAWPATPATVVAARQLGFVQERRWVGQGTPGRRFLREGAQEGHDAAATRRGRPPTASREHARSRRGSCRCVSSSSFLISKS